MLPLEASHLKLAFCSVPNLLDHISGTYEKPPKQHHSSNPSDLRGLEPWMIPIRQEAAGPLAHGVDLRVRVSGKPNQQWSIIESRGIGDPVV